MAQVYSRKLFTHLTIVIAFLSINSCSNREEKGKTIYYMIETEKPPAVIDPNEPPPPPTPFYGRINIILMGQSSVFVHRVDENAASVHDNPTIPMHLDLTQADIQNIDLDSLPDFLKSEYRNLDSTNYRNYFTCIKSPSDTITNRALEVIQKFFQERKFKAYIIRHWTPQEQQLFTSKR
ncbi:hypothetical protein [Larkinella rosea]|uniref:Uncharacterized protein n=1 Tax=Larkinella rosea TaxID=2025312 RepID=A0A3P1BGR7_9BACT|nr:hypothetical protein [Larkinella rosea]RRB00136.1 hypothetical protein EHT25_26290 [Larkinella rosea]